MRNDKQIYKTVRQINEISGKYIGFIDSLNPCALTDRYVEQIIVLANELTELYKKAFNIDEITF